MTKQREGPSVSSNPITLCWFLLHVLSKAALLSAPQAVRCEVWVSGGGGGGGACVKREKAQKGEGRGEG